MIDICYEAHKWIKKKYGKATLCEKCGATGRVHWSNKGHTYRHIRKEWQQLCPKCHKRYDRPDSVIPYFEKMKVGDAVEIMKSEWKTKTDPVVLVSSAFHRGRSGMRFMSRTEADRWIIKRLS